MEYQASAVVLGGEAAELEKSIKEDRERGISTWERPADCKEPLPPEAVEVSSCIYLEERF